MSKMTAGEAAERIYRLLANGKCMDGLVSIKGDYFEDALELAAFILRRVASGELADVVHAHCIDRENDCFCSNCNSPNVAHGQRYCEDCGAILDGKDDSHEVN